MTAVSTLLEQRQRESAIWLGQGLGWFRAILMVGVAPLIEEVTYRGCLYAALRKRMSVWAANPLSSLAFALSHFYRLTLPQVFLIGVLSAYAFERTRSLRASIVLHAAWNLLGVMTVNPWIASVFAVSGFIAWRSVRRPVMGDDRRTGWKIYTVMLPLLLGGAYAFNATIAWQAVFELPLVFGLALYAWKQVVGPRVLWRTYGVAYSAWIVFRTWIDAIPKAVRLPWQQSLATSDPILTTTELAIEVFSALLIIGPAVLAIWKLGKPGETGKSGK